MLAVEPRNGHETSADSASDASWKTVVIPTKMHYALYRGTFCLAAVVSVNPLAP